MVQHESYTASIQVSKILIHPIKVGRYDTFHWNVSTKTLYTCRKSCRGISVTEAGYTSEGLEVGIRGLRSVQADIYI